MTVDYVMCGVYILFYSEGIFMINKGSIGKKDICGVVLALMDLTTNMLDVERGFKIPTIVTNEDEYSIIGIKYIAASYNLPVLEFYTLKDCGEKGKITFSSDFYFLKYDKFLKGENDNLNNKHDYLDS